MSQKGVLYDEMYFASTDELNDPVDMKSYFVFPADSEENWVKVLTVVWGDNCESMNYRLVAKYLSSLCPMDYFEFLDKKKYVSEYVFKICINSGSLNILSPGQIYQLINKFLSFIDLYQPNTGYSVSLSKNNDETLMWSHYASSHRGFCLIFKAIDSKNISR